MTDFSNTAIAFRSKSAADLNRSYWLFRLMDFPRLVRLGTRLVILAMRLHLPIGWFLKRTLFRQFCGGETIETCAGTIQELARFQIGTILDYSVEGNGSEGAFDDTANEILRTVELARGNPKIPFCVFKVTGIARFGLLKKMAARQPLLAAEELEWQRARARMEKICSRAYRDGVRIFVDAEESWIQDTIDDLTHQMMERFNRERPLVYNTLQMYRTDRLELLKRIHETAEKKGYSLGLKLVRGAYLDKERDRARELGLPSPVFDDKVSTDRAFDSALMFCVERLSRIAMCAGTHNEASVRLLIERMRERDIARSDPRVYLAQLLGMSDHLSYNLADAGYNVAKYVPYGPVQAVVPYLIRRAEENTAIQGQSSRELALLTAERLRRKQSAVGTGASRCLN